MNVAALLLELQAHGVTLTVADGQLAMKGKTAPPPRLLQAAKVLKIDIIKTLKVFDEQGCSSNKNTSGTLKAHLMNNKAQIQGLEVNKAAPWTLENFRQHDCYPSISNGLLRLLKATGEPVTDAGIISAWEAAKDTIQAQLEARYAILTTWTEALLKKQGRVYLFMPETVAPKSGTISSGFSDPKELAAEVLRAEALGLWYELTRR